MALKLVAVSAILIACVQVCGARPACGNNSLNVTVHDRETLNAFLVRNLAPAPLP